MVIVKNKKHSYEENTGIQQRKGKHQSRKEREEHKERTNVRSQEDDAHKQKKNEKKALTQIQNPSLGPEPFTSDVKQIKQREESES